MKKNEGSRLWLVFLVLVIVQMACSFVTNVLDGQETEKNIASEPNQEKTKRSNPVPQYFFTIDELFDRGDKVYNRPVRVSGVVIGDSIEYDSETLTLRFTIAHISADNDILEIEGGLTAAIQEAANDPNRTRMQVVYHGVKPDLLQHETQAIITGQLGEDGIFVAEELLLKCPSRYEAATP